MKDLFTWVMEAEGDELEAFDQGPSDNPAPPDQPTEEAPAGDEDLVGAPPTSDDMGEMPDDMSDDTMTNGDTGDENTGTGRPAGGYTWG